MKNISRLLFVALLIVGAAIPGKAHVYVGDGEPSRGSKDLKQTTAGCSPSSAYEWLNINNVKTRYNAGGDMWWDLPGGIGAQYFIPANGSATSLFAGALWIAGVDVNNQLKCAAVRFRQGPNVTGGGNDFWTGPLTLNGANIDAATCAAWDRIWKITRAEVDEFLLHCTGAPPTEGAKYGTFVDHQDGYSIPKVITEWPAHPEQVEGGNIDDVSHYLAPFYDNDGDGEYDPMQGDFPYYDIENELCHTKILTLEEERNGTVKGSILADQVLKGDMTLWWVFNDKGNTHTESEGSAIGLEIRAQAFAFATNDEINNMSFCSYEIINRSTYELAGTYFCPWTDVDLGYAKDDYVGCDVKRGLGYGYNGNAIDGSGEPEAYGDQPPAVGVDFFQGPYMDADGLDNPKYTYVITATFDHISPEGDSIYIYDTLANQTQQICDESINGVNFQNGIIDDERFGMRRFLYHNNDDSNTGDPKYASHYYNFLRGIWKDGNKMLYGGNAHPSGSGTVGPACDFMFPGDSDPCNWGTGGEIPGGGYNTNGKYWTDAEAGNKPADRRFMQSAGPFTLLPGAVNYITFGVPWARATSGGPQASVELLRVTDDKCQALFENCFKVIDGPSAPDLTIRELDQKLIIYLSNSPVSNNYKEGYNEIDPEIPERRPDDSTMACDRNYHFEGYKVYQLFNDQVGADELNDNNKARLVFQCDIRNKVTNLVNYEWNDHIGAIVPELSVEGGDAGITHSFVITEDKFATGDNPALVNHKSYYYMAVAYAYNNYMDYSQDPSIEYGLYGQKKPYLEGRKNIQCYTAVPHQTLNGVVLRCDYGQKPGVKRIVGQGNGGNQLELEQECIDELFTKKLASTHDENGDSIVLGHPDYPIIYHPSYKIGYGPLDVKVIDPLNVKTTKYELWFEDFFADTTYDVSTNQLVHIQASNGTWVVGSEAVRMASHWYLKAEGEDPMPCDTITTYTDEKMFIDKGISVTIKQPYEVGPIVIGGRWEAATSSEPGHYVDYMENLAENSGLITTSFTFQDSTKKWLDGIRDLDEPSSVLNWIRAGNYYDYENTETSDFDMANTEYPQLAHDPNEAFEKIANRTWAPAALCAYQAQSVFPVADPAAEQFPGYQLSRIGSIDIVMTADTSKWTRCPVVELCPDNKLSQNGTNQYELRRAPSVDKMGQPYMVLDSATGRMVQFSDWENATDPKYRSENINDPNFISPQGMGWFPGYAIDLESGARLNFIFGEDSYLEDLNGSDMIFNPPALRQITVEGGSQYADPVLFRQYDSEPVFGGKHYVYILGIDRPKKVVDGGDIPNSSPMPASRFNCPAYDGGRYAFGLLHHFQNVPKEGRVLKRFLWRQVLYIGMPMGVEGLEWLPEGNDAKISIRVAKPYAPGYAAYELDSVYPGLDVNNMYPKYEFSIDGLDPIAADPEKMESDLDMITIVPNPYYAYSSYEANALNNLVRITNLPNKCTVTIYNLSGTKIRQFRKDNEISYIDWDLTNFANTPVASGFYLIHVAAQDANGNITAERTVKFFGAMRLIDLNTF